MPAHATTLGRKKPKYEIAIRCKNGKTIKAYFEKAVGLNAQPGKLKGLRKFTSITLKGGFTSNSALFDWYLQHAGKSKSNSKVRITLLDGGANAIHTWNLNNGMPSKITAPAFTAKGAGDIRIETLVLCGDGLALVSDCKDC